MLYRFRGALLIAAIAFLLFVVLGRQKQEVAKPTSPPIVVKAMHVTSSDLPIAIEFVGQTRGALDAEVRARVEGVVTGLYFEEGKEVEEGQRLYSIDPAPYQAKVAEAQGKVAEAQTMLVKAESDLARIRPLVEMRAMSERDLDRAVAQEGVARASVQAAMATLESAKIELGYCEITSPTKGIIGYTKAKVGEFVGRPPNPVVLNTVSKLDPIHVNFSVTEKDYLYFSRLRQKQIESGEKPTKRELQMVLADGSTYPERGEMISIGRAIDPATGTISLEAAFPNPHQLIRPGQFAKIKAVAETASGVLAIPKRAIRELQGQFQVIAVKSDSTAEVRNVTLGRAIGDKQIVEKGIAENDIIVTDGLQRLKSGMAVEPKFEE